MRACSPVTSPHAQAARAPSLLGWLVGWLVAGAAIAGCATIPHGRYGVSDVEIRGMEHLDEAALRACLGTRERSQFGVDLGASSDLTCGTPPFDAGRFRVDFFAWPWTDWPLFDASVFDRDVARVERWMRARGYYEGRVVSTEVFPEEAVGGQAPPDADEGRCIADDARGCDVRVRFTVEEGEPVRVARISVRAIDDAETGATAPRAADRRGRDDDEDDGLPRELRGALREVLELHRGDIFDEARYEQTKLAMLRVLADLAYPEARVSGEVKIAAARHEAFVVFSVRTGRPAVLGRVCVRGHGELPATPILAATYLEPGQRFSLRAIEEGQRAVYALGTVSSVQITHRSTDDPDAVPDPAPVRDPDAPADESAPDDSHPDDSASDDSASPDSASPDSASADSASPEPAPTPPPEPPRVCLEPSSAIPDGHTTVDLDIRVQPGRLERHGIGIGWQVGDTVSFGSQGTSSSATAVNQQAVSQWDFHLLLALEWRNLFGDMLRLRIEERPRIIFPVAFPGVETPDGQGPRPGNRILLTIRWPAFLEPRTSLFAALTHDYGPAPLFGFFRHELDARLGLERTFFDGRLYLSAAVRGNLYLPDGVQNVRVLSARESTRALILEQVITLDLRDDPRNPTEGAFFAVDLQEAGWGGASSWDYVRVTAEGRGYVPLPAGIVIAARFGIGVMEIIGEPYDLDRRSRYELANLGPLSQQLQGGGSIGNRGFPPGFLGEVVRREIEARPRPDGGQGAFPPVIISGGTRRWEGSLELRIPITPEIGVVGFGDVGNVTRGGDFRFDHPNLAVGFGLRYRTIIGPLRLDVAFRPLDEQTDYDATYLAPCATNQSYECRPVPWVALGDLRWPGAIHLTIGEAF